jgi:hypothetical protein
MSEQKHMQGVSKNEQRQYQHIKETAEESERYGDRAAEVAARPVLKHHTEEGHEKGR